MCKHFKMSGFEFVYHALTLIKNSNIQRSGSLKKSFDCLEKETEKVIPNGIRNFFHQTITTPLLL
jgi:hypothetical protein